MRIIKPTLLVVAICSAVTASMGGFDSIVGTTIMLGNSIGISTTSAGIDTKGSSNSCVLRRFECSKNNIPSCFKRWHSKEISCNDSACTGVNCMTKADFSARYTFQQWDFQNLQGPFPRNETMCITQVSDCAINESFCISPVSLQQVPCEEQFCKEPECFKHFVFVDKDDGIITGTPNTKDAINDNKGKNEEDDEQEEDTDELEDKIIDVNIVQNSDDNQQKENESPTNRPQESIEAHTNDSLKVVTLGCFNSLGAWTTDRSQCATNQKPYVEPSSTLEDSTQSEAVVQDESVIQSSIEELFIPDTRKNTLIQQLLSSATEAEGRLHNILENPALTDALRASLMQRLESIQTIQRSLAEPTVTIMRLQEIAGTLVAELHSIQQIVKVLSSKETAPPETVTNRLDRIFTQLPTVFTTLLQEGIPVDSMTTQGFISAAQLYDVVRTECMATPSTCSKLSAVLDLLDPVFTNIHQSLESANRGDLEAKIDELLR